MGAVDGNGASGNEEEVMKEMIENKVEERMSADAGSHTVPDKTQARMLAKYIAVFEKHMAWFDEELTRFGRKKNRFNLSAADCGEVENLLNKAVSAVEDAEHLLSMHLRDLEGANI